MLLNRLTILNFFLQPVSSNQAALFDAEPMDEPTDSKPAVLDPEPEKTTEPGNEMHNLSMSYYVYLQSMH